MQDLVGRRLGQYQIIRLIGRGGMATVYAGLQATLNRQVALKVLSPGMATDSTFVERFRREATIVARLQHPNILPVYDFGQEDGLLYIAMMMVAAGTLSERVSNLPLALAVQIGSQLADALDYAHGLGVVHRDIKPSNVLMAREDWALLADFGIARLRESPGLTVAGASLGTPEYMSPEQALGQSIDQRSDIYSLGILLYEMVAGRVPFRADGPFATVRLHLETPVPPPSATRQGLPPAIDAIVARATRKSPAERYQSAAELKRELTAVGIALATVLPSLEGSAKTQAIEWTPAQPAGPPGFYPRPTTVSPRFDATRPAPLDSVDQKYQGPAVPQLAPAPIARSERGVGWIVATLGCAFLVGCAAVLGLGALLSSDQLPELLGLGATPTSTQAPGAPTRTATGGRATPTVTRTAATATRPPSSPTLIPVGALLWSDNMQANTNGWAVDTTSSDARFYFANGVYHIENHTPSSDWYSVPTRLTTSYQSFVLEADITKVDGPDNQEFGVLFRQKNRDGYRFFITGQGRFNITRYVDSLNGHDSMIGWQTDAANVINRGNAKNRIKVVARGTEIVIYANDRWLAQSVETKPDASREGTIGLVAGPGVHISVSAIRVFAVGN